MTTTTHYYGVLYIFSHNKLKHKEKYERRHKNHTEWITKKIS